MHHLNNIRKMVERIEKEIEILREKRDSAKRIEVSDKIELIIGINDITIYNRDTEDYIVLDNGDVEWLRKELNNLIS